MTEDQNQNDSEMVQRARAAFEQQVAFQEAVRNVSALTPKERAVLRKKRQKAAEKQEAKQKKLRAKTLEVRSVLRRFNPNLGSGQIRRMADEYIAAKANPEPR